MSVYQRVSITGPFAGDDFGHALSELAEGSCARQPGRFYRTRATLPTAQGAYGKQNMMT